jgi:hypothetical protein
MCCAEMDLFAVVKLEKPKQVTVGVRPLRDNEEPILEATAGHITVLAQAGPEDSPPIVVLVTPVQSVPPTGEPSHVVEELRAESSDSVEVLEPEIVAQGVKCKGEADGAGTSKRRRHLITDEESAAEDDTSATGVDKEIAKASPLL